MGGVVNAVKDVGGAIPGIGMAFGQGPLGSLFGGASAQQAAAQVNSVNPQIGQVQQAQLKQANDYSANLPNLQKDQINSATDANRLKTLSDQKSAVTNANSRGMLYGDYAQNKSNAATASNQSALNNQIAGINYNTANAGQTLNNQAINSGLISQGFNQDYNNAVYQAAMGAQQQNRQNTSGLINGIAGFAGL